MEEKKFNIEEQKEQQYDKIKIDFFAEYENTGAPTFGGKSSTMGMDMKTQMAMGFLGTLSNKTKGIIVVSVFGVTYLIICGLVWNIQAIASLF